MKKSILMLGLAAAIGLTSAQAQNIPSRENEGVKKEGRIENKKQMLEGLNLTNDQRKKMQAIQKESHAKRQAIMNDNSLSQDQKKEKLADLRNDQKTTISAILTPEQLAKLNANAKSGNDGKGRRGKSANAENGESNKGVLKERNISGKDKNGLAIAGRDNRGMKDLNLTQEQKSKMKLLNEESRDKMQAIRDNSSLTSEQKKSQIQELMKDIQRKRKDILTAEQEMKWESQMNQMRKNRPLSRRK